MFSKFSKVAMEHGGSTLSPDYIYKAVNIFLKDGSTTCLDAINESEIIMKMIKENTKVDAVIGMSTCSVFVSHLLKAPFIVFSPVGPMPLFLSGIGDPVNLFVQPHPLLTSIAPLSFFERIKNILIGNAWNAFILYISNLEKHILEESFGRSIPDFQDILKERTALCIANSHFVTHGNWPYYKNVVEIGGAHLKPGKPLPSDLQNYMDSHPEGVVYVSFGSTFKASEMKKEQKLVFINSFKMLNIPIIWKWNDDDLSEIPRNVRVEKWVPQNDLLAHPNLKVFVTHGGLLSTQEALYHGIPLVGVPLAQDQISNVVRAEKNGFAIKVNLDNISVESLVSAIKKAMVDVNIQKSVERMHNLFVATDVQGTKTPLEKGIDAVEFVIKHQYCDFLKPQPLQASWYKVYGYDLFAVVLGVLGLVTFTSLKLISCFIKSCCFRKRKQD